MNARDEARRTAEQTGGQHALPDTDARERRRHQDGRLSSQRRRECRRRGWDCSGRRGCNDGDEGDPALCGRLEMRFRVPPQAKPLSRWAWLAGSYRSGRKARVRCDEFGAAPPYSIHAQVLFIAYYASAEASCHPRARLAGAGTGARPVQRVPQPHQWRVIFPRKSGHHYAV